MPVAFCQVREDPEIDLEVLSQCPAGQIAMIGSGGDTLCFLSQKLKCSQIHVIDQNSSQLAMCSLKNYLLKNNTLDERLVILGYQPASSRQREELLNILEKESEVDLSRIAPKDYLVKFGLDFCGRYEFLFKEVQANLPKDLIRTLVNDLKFTDSHNDFVWQKLRQTINSNFKQHTLERLFGKNATSNPREPFADHFYNQLVSASKQPYWKNNPWVLNFISEPQKEILYPWHDLNYRRHTKIGYHNESMLKYLSHAKEGQFTFIHLSNVLDWCTENEASALFRQVKRTLKPGGKFILRQLNSSLNIAAFCPMDLIEKMQSRLTQKDKSFFYKNIWVGEKK